MRANKNYPTKTYNEKIKYVFSLLVEFILKRKSWIEILQKFPSFFRPIFLWYFYVTNINVAGLNMKAGF